VWRSVGGPTEAYGSRISSEEKATCGAQGSPPQGLSLFAMLARWLCVCERSPLCGAFLYDDDDDCRFIELIVPYRGVSLTI